MREDDDCRDENQSAVERRVTLLDRDGGDSKALVDGSVEGRMVD